MIKQIEENMTVYVRKLNFTAKNMIVWSLLFSSCYIRLLNLESLNFNSDFSLLKSDFNIFLIVFVEQNDVLNGSFAYLIPLRKIF